MTRHWKSVKLSPRRVKTSKSVPDMSLGPTCINNRFTTKVVMYAVDKGKAEDTSNMTRAEFDGTKETLLLKWNNKM